MANELETSREVGLRDLLAGIAGDIHSLIAQQLTLFRLELSGAYVRSREAASFVAAGLATAIAGGVLLGLMLVHGLAELAPQLGLWICYAIVGGPTMAAGLILCFVGMRRLRPDATVGVDGNEKLRENTNGR